MSKTKFIILGLLSESDLSGYDINKIIKIRFSFFWNESYGQIYPTLKKLCEENLLIKKPTENSGKRQKVIYSITEKGLEDLKKWLLKPTEKEIVRFEILLKLYFGNLSTPDVSIKQLKLFRRRTVINYKILKEMKNQLNGIINLHENHIFVIQTISFGLKTYAAYIKWADETIKLLSNQGGVKD
jgi:DNA-binding PadR family transcriptional regulator